MTKPRVLSADLQTVDKGWAWVVVSAAFMCLFFTLGFSYSTGVYYITFLDTFGQTKGMTAWISSLNFGVLCGIGPLASMLINTVSCRFTTVLGGLIASIGLLSSAFATSIYTLFFTFGVLTGAGSGLVFTSCVVVISEYFVKHRVVAMGLSLSGAGLGTIAFPWISRLLIGHFAWRGALMVTAAMNLHNIAFGLLMRPNRRKTYSISIIEVESQSIISIFESGNKERSAVALSTDQKSKTKTGQTEKVGTPKSQRKHPRTCKTVIEDLNLDLFTNFTFILLCINTFLYCFGMSVMYTHISAYAATVELKQSARTLLLSCIGFSNLLGRVSLGFIAQFLPINITYQFMLSYLLAGLGVGLCALWTSFEGLLVSVCVFGYFSAGFGPLLSEVTCLAVGVMKFSMAYGYLMIFMAIGTMVGAPIAGSVYDSTLMYHYSFYLGGFSLVLSAVIMLPERMLSAWKSREYTAANQQETA